jgi:hypothetical protein
VLTLFGQSIWKVLIPSLLQITLLTEKVLFDMLGFDSQAQAMENRGELRRTSSPG